MNKKLIAIIAIIAALIIAVCLILFTGKDSNDNKTTAAPSDGQPATIVFDEEKDTQKTEKKDYDTKITVTLPIDVVDDEYGDDLDAFAKAKGYFSVKKTDDGHVKIKMREYSYRLLLTSKGIETVGAIGYSIDCGDFPFVVRLEKYNSDFSEVIFKVDKEKYESTENKDAFFDAMAFYCLYYQDYNIESNGKCKIILCEKGTNKVIESRELTEGAIV